MSSLTSWSIGNGVRLGLRPRRITSRAPKSLDFLVYARAKPDLTLSYRSEYFLKWWSRFLNIASKQEVNVSFLKDITGNAIGLNSSMKRVSMSPPHAINASRTATIPAMMQLIMEKEPCQFCSCFLVWTTHSCHSYRTTEVRILCTAEARLHFPWSKPGFAMSRHAARRWNSTYGR